jgi:hypothetical protein
MHQGGIRPGKINWVSMEQALKDKSVDDRDSTYSCRYLNPGSICDFHKNPMKVSISHGKWGLFDFPRIFRGN